MALLQLLLYHVLGLRVLPGRGRAAVTAADLTATLGLHMKIVIPLDVLLLMTRAVNELFLVGQRI